MMSAGTPQQLPLELPLRPSFARDDFLIGASNKPAIDQIERWPDWQSPMLMLVGPQGSGKSHLAAIWAELSHAAVMDGRDVARWSPSSLAAGQPVVIENADAVERSEAALFHLLNIIRETGSALLLTARTRPDLWNLRTADLLSRLRLAPVIEIAAPDDDLLRALMVKLFADRQLIVDANVIDFVLARIERSFAAVASIVDALDREALALGRRITRPIAAGILNRQDVLTEE